MVMALSISSSPLVLTPNLNRSDSLSRLSYPTPRLRVSDNQCSIKAIRLSRTHIDPTAHNDRQPLYLHFKLPLQLASASVVLFLGFGVRICSAGPAQLPLTPIVTQQDQLLNQGPDQEEDEKLKQEFENWKSKTYALTVPLRVVSLQNSVPQSWVKEFMRSQGKRLKFQMNLCASIDGIVNNLSVPFNKVKAKSAPYMAADLVSVGDSWLSFAIKKRLIEPIAGAEDQDWFKCLSHKWKSFYLFVYLLLFALTKAQVYLRRNDAGEIDPRGKIWAAPYRWGTMVIAYKKSKFRKHNLAPIEDWKDLWRPELAGRISMVNSPREVIGSVLKYMGASYNSNNIDLQVAGGKISVQQNLALLANQVDPGKFNKVLVWRSEIGLCNSRVFQARLFDSTHYLKAFGIGDVWVAVGWSSDVLPAVKRMSNVAVVVPKSGASLWADLWAIPAASRLETKQIGGRVRGPSPLIHQWIEFCLQTARALPFKQEVIPGASPSALETTLVKLPEELLKGKPSQDTNLIVGVPPAEILARCEFLEPLSEATLSDYEWLVADLQKPAPVLMKRVQHYLSSLIQSFLAKATLKS
ncbi:spermidine/putrescine-binding periplasmic protein [Citrus sinensis]|uniref:Spermidine/putrescine-binding periplasmic protein n=1 Tax=Citrus sinensis TaxID=2711 RepID=A0ACB8KGR2_CITSI|nr:spermidine/putrescine-binding periplasmic protein [Citrus sinensis]